MKTSSFAEAAPLALGLALLGFACQAERAQGSAAGQPAESSQSRPSEPLGSRAEIVALAAALAAGASQQGPRGAESLMAAARLRTRLFRREHRRVDGLEAIELERELARVAPGERCESELRQALLAGELGGDPRATYLELYRLLAAANGGCRARLEAALVALAGFRPSPAELEGVRVAGPAASASSAGAAPPASTIVSAAPAANARISRIERYFSKDAARLVVFVSQPVRFEVSELAASSGEGGRLVLDVAGARYEGAPQFEVGGLVERVRVAQREAGTRLVLDLSGAVERRVFYVPEPFRLVIDVGRPGATAEARRAVRRVVLDPGHGGHDPGAVGPTGLREKDVALDIAHRAAPLIARELGISTLLTRDSDVFVPLEERTARANAFGADLFISIHCNAAEHSGGSGVMTFVLDETKDQLSSRLAAVENSASAAAGSELAAAYSQLADGDTAGRSREFAALLQRAAQASLSTHYADVPDGGVKRAGFFVLAGARMPAVLFETSFISSAREETRFNTGDFRQKLADAIVNAVRAFREGKTPG